MADKVGIPQKAPGSASESSGEGSSHQFGLTAAMALIVGSIIGVGIFNLPTSLAVYGPITLVSVALTRVGALVLALLFAALSRRLPADGGPYGITAAIPYAFSALAQLKWRWADHRTLETPRFARDMIVAVLALVFSILFIWYSRNTGHSFWVYWAPFFLAGGALLLGIPVYLGQRRHMSQPAPVPPYREVERGG